MAWWPPAAPDSCTLMKRIYGENSLYNKRAGNIAKRARQQSNKTDKTEQSDKSEASATRPYSTDYIMSVLLLAALLQPALLAWSAPSQSRRAVLQRAAALAAGPAPLLVVAPLPASADLDAAALDRAIVTKQRELSAPIRSARQGVQDRLAEEADRLEKRSLRLTVGQSAPAGPASMTVQNCADKQRLSLGDLRGRYVVLWFFPEYGFDSGNAAEALQFQRLLAEFSKLDAVVVGCSGQQPAAQRSKLIDPQGLSFPMLVDADDALSTAYGARSPVAGETRALDRTRPITTLPGPPELDTRMTGSPIAIACAAQVRRGRRSSSTRSEFCAGRRRASSWASASSPSRGTRRACCGSSSRYTTPTGGACDCERELQ